METKRKNDSFVGRAFRAVLLALICSVLPATGQAAYLLHVYDAASVFTTPAVTGLTEGQSGDLVIQLYSSDTSPDVCPTPSFVADITIGVVNTGTGSASANDIVQTFPRTVRLDSSVLCATVYDGSVNLSGAYPSITSPFSLVRYVGFTTRDDAVYEGGVESLTFAITNVTPVSGGATFLVETDSAPGTAVTQYQVYDGNSKPVFVSGSPPSVVNATENQQLVITIEAYDPDVEDEFTFSVGNAPPGAVLTSPGPNFESGFSEFLWTPGFDDQGSRQVSFLATDLQGAVGQANVTIVVANVNRPPVMNQPGDHVLSEGQAFTLGISATDPDSNGLSFEMNGAPAGAMLSDNGDGSAELSWTPGFDQAGNYSVTVTVTDDDPENPLSDSATFNLSVSDVNEAPYFLEGYPPTSVSAFEGEELVLMLEAADPNSTDTLTLSMANPPTGSSLMDPGPHTGGIAVSDFVWTPGFEAAGNYPVTFIVNDDHPTDPREGRVDVTITVGNTNRPPILEPVGNQTLNEGVPFELNLMADDPDGNALSFEIGDAPIGSLFFDNGGGTAVFSWTPGFDQAGNYPVTFTVVDDDPANPLTDSETVNLTVGEGNRPPVLSPVGSRVVDEGETLALQLFASDPDGDSLAFSASALPPGALFDTRSGRFSWTPDYDQAGNYSIAFYVQDNGTPPLQDNEVVTISVGNVNRPPVLAPIGNRMVDEGEILEIVLDGSDPDGDALSYGVDGALPVGAELSGNRFTWTPGYDMGGSVITLTFLVSDGDLSDAVTVSLTVGNVNRPPVLTPIGDRDLNEGRTLQLMPSATDADGDAVTIVLATELPPGAVYEDGVFSWTPMVGQAGTYPLGFQATDDGEPPASDAESIQIRVFDQGDVNRDGHVDSVDVELILRYARMPVNAQIDQLDVNGDGMISVLDARLAVLNCGLADCVSE